MNTATLKGSIRAEKTLRGSIRYVDHVGVNGAQVYEGEYTVKPELTERILQTKGKSMLDNVTIREIPIDTVTNAAGGNTIIIG